MRNLEQRLNDLDAYAAAVIYEVQTDRLDHEHYTGGYHTNGDRMPGTPEEEVEGRLRSMTAYNRIIDALYALHGKFGMYATTIVLLQKFINEVRQRTPEDNEHDYWPCRDYICKRMNQ